MSCVQLTNLQLIHLYTRYSDLSLNLEVRKITKENVINPSSIYFLVNYFESEVMKVKQAKTRVCVLLVEPGGTAYRETRMRCPSFGRWKIYETFFELPDGIVGLASSIESDCLSWTSETIQHAVNFHQQIISEKSLFKFDNFYSSRCTQTWWKN